ncbi:hypothetical protein KEM54_001424 [Ascosphaera aggregata]|nr:hypothetical protein KEM54_001424 [Ascosphaera aggregata]
MSLLHSLEQISQSAESIAQLPFQPPKSFTNAFLHCDDITTLIRDTEPHERAVFSVDVSSAGSTSNNNNNNNNNNSNANANTTANRQRWTTVDDYATAAAASSSRSSSSSMASRIYAAQDGKYRQSAVARVLGGDMMSQIRRTTTMGGVDARKSHGDRDGVDVGLLLRGAEMLCKVYPVSGARERIEMLRVEYLQLKGSLEKLEREVEDQNVELERMKYGRGYEHDEHDDQEEEEEDEEMMDVDQVEAQELGLGAVVTAAEIEAEKNAIRELEERRKELERMMMR